MTSASRRSPGVATSASADGQTVQVTVPEEPTPSTFSFDYTVNNGTTAKNGRATAKVTVRIVGVRGQHARRSCARVRRSWRRRSTPSSPDGSVRVGVVADWRDAENDPIQVARPWTRRPPGSTAPAP